MPVGAGRQPDQVERESWRHPEPWRPPPATRRGWGSRTSSSLPPLPSDRGESQAGPVRCPVSSAILQVEASFCLPPPRPPLPQGLGSGLSRLLALFPFLKKPSSASPSPPESLLGSRPEGHRGGVKADPLMETRLCQVWGGSAKPAPGRGADPRSLPVLPPPPLPAAAGPLRASLRAAVPDQPERPLKFYAE